jgi:hypothetical protein
LCQQDLNQLTYYTYNPCTISGWFWCFLFLLFVVVVFVFVLSMPTQHTKVNQQRLVKKSRKLSGRVNGFSSTCGTVLVIVKIQWSNAVMKWKVPQVRTVPKPNPKITETEAQSMPLTLIYTSIHSPFFIRAPQYKLMMLRQLVLHVWTPLSEMRRLYTRFAHVRKGQLWLSVKTAASLTWCYCLLYLSCSIDTAK